MNDFLTDVTKIRQRARQDMEEILRVEEEHADNLSNMLATLETAISQIRGKTV